MHSPIWQDDIALHSREQGVPYIMDTLHRQGNSGLQGYRALLAEHSRIRVHLLLIPPNQCGRK